MMSAAKKVCVVNASGNIKKDIEVAVGELNLALSIEVSHFSSESEFIEQVISRKIVPWLIVHEHSDQDKFGAGFLGQIKSHCKTHFIPVINISKENICDSDIRNSIGLGASALLKNPLEKSIFQIAVTKRVSQDIDYQVLEDLDRSFSDEILDHVENVQSKLGSLNLKTVDEIYRVFHTIKGVAGSLQLPLLFQAVHYFENFLTAIKTGNLYGLPESKTVLAEIFSYLESQSQRIRSGSFLSAPEKELTNKVASLVEKVKGGFRFELTQNSPPQSQADSVNESGAIVSRTATSVRISNEHLDQLQENLKKMIQARLKITSFANRLKAEFGGETFPDELVKISNDLGENLIAAMDFFISLRVVSVTQLKNMAEKIFHQANEQLKKDVDFEWHCSSHLEIDSVVLECLGIALTHLLRNSLDHGIEDDLEKSTSGKSERSCVRVSIEKSDRDQFVVSVEDNGKGINAEKLRKKALEHGLMEEQSLSALETDKVLEFIFADGLTTKETVTEISGRGVGLGAVRESLSKLGGQIKVASELGKGTKFEIRAPRLFKL